MIAILCAAVVLSLALAPRAECAEAVPPGLTASTYAPGEDAIRFRWPTHIAFGPGKQEIVTDLKNESALTAPVGGYARSLTFANGKLYAIGSAKGRIVEIIDWDARTFAIHDSHDPTGRDGSSGYWKKTGLVLNDAEFFEGFWYATSYFTHWGNDEADFDEHKFIRFKTFEDLRTGNWTDLSSLLPSGMTPYYLTAEGEHLYVAIFNHRSPGSGDAILRLTPEH